ncbi:hypothetical protein JZ751_013333 [Albula glossodonta]|uniref:Uncharacterized protein n=1 Tax=Albula glossodonta TaxID=121402 RepID=A0A8T2NUB5_9TELE|nr:hypothetical protein JZ751_013333 [Albula glossodonta]
MEMREVTVVTGSFVGFQLLFSVASPLLSSAFTAGYGRLPPAKHTEWNSRHIIFCRFHVGVKPRDVVKEAEKYNNACFKCEGKEREDVDKPQREEILHSIGRAAGILNLKHTTPARNSVNKCGGGGCVSAVASDNTSGFVSTIHALIVGLFCVYILWFDDAVNEDPVW